MGEISPFALFTLVVIAFDLHFSPQGDDLLGLFVFVAQLATPRFT